MSPNTLTGGLAPLSTEQDNASSYRPFDEDDDDREITAITVLEIETNKAKEAVAKLRDSRSSRISKTALTPPPVKKQEKEEKDKNSSEDSSSWNMRAIYNNSVFDIGMSITLSQGKILTLKEAIRKVVPYYDDVIKVNITLITGSLDITKQARYRVLERQGQVVTFSKYNTDFSTVKFTALTHSTRFLLIAWRP